MRCAEIVPAHLKLVIARRHQTSFAIRVRIDVIKSKIRYLFRSIGNHAAKEQSYGRKQSFHLPHSLPATGVAVKIESAAPPLARRVGRGHTISRKALRLPALCFVLS